MTGSFDDDLLVSFEGGGLLRVTRRRTPAEAKAFAEVYRKALQGGRVEADGDLVIASVGEPPGRKAIVALLR